MHPPHPVALVVLSEDLADLHHQPLVLQSRALSARPSRAGSTPTPTPPGAADELDAEAIAMPVDERAHLVRPPSSSVAKNTEAARKISFASRSSATSRLSSLDLLPLLTARQPGPQALIGLRLPHALPQRLRRQPDLRRDMRDRTTRLDRQPHHRDQSTPGGTSSDVTSAEVLLTQDRCPRNRASVKPGLAQSKGSSAGLPYHPHIQHADLAITSRYLRGIDNAEIVQAVHERPEPMIPASRRLAPLR